MPFGSLSTPDVTAYTWDLEVAGTNRAGRYVRLFGVQIVLQDDVAATGPADDALRYAHVGITYGSPVDDRSGVQIEL